MVRLDKRTNIFNLIKNEDSTVDDFKKLHDIAPEKFKLILENMNVYEYAEEYKRNDLLKFLKTVTEISISDKIINLVKLKNKPNELRDFLKDKNLKDLTKDEQVKIIEKLYDNEDQNDVYHKLIILLDKGIDINTLILNDTTFIPNFFIDISMFKYIINKYNFNVNNKNKHGHTILYYPLLNNEYEVVKFLLEKGVNVNDMINNDGYMYYIYNHIPDNDKNKYYKLFLEHGINPDQSLNIHPLLIIVIHNKNKDIFDLLLEKGADVNKISTRNITPLSVSLLNKDIYYIRKLIEKGADVNQFINIPPHPILLTAIFTKQPIDIIKLIIDAGANKDAKFRYTNGKETTSLKHALEKYDSDKEYFGKVIELLGGEIPKPAIWKGFTRSDIEKFDIFFEKPFDWSCCPICLEYIERSDGCMYMSHNCANTGHYYHKKLYDKYAYERFAGSGKKIEWCTICGRITENHKHFKLSAAQEASKEKAALNPEIQVRLGRGDNFAFFDNANCVGFGGGGTEEKASRFRRMREYALELQEDVDKKEYNDVMEELIEEVWNSPLIRNRKIKKILEDKRWNINVKEFPENKKNNTAKNNNANAANIPYNGTKPTIVDDDCIIFAEDDDKNTRETNPKFYFHHETIGGLDHNGIYICQKDLAKAIEIKNAEFGLESFGKCWWPQCKGVLHPEELKGIIPELLYNEYRKKFNKKMAKKGGTRKMKNQRGGNVKSVLHELNNGTCTPHNLNRNGTPRKL